MLNPARQFMSLHSFIRTATVWMASGICVAGLSGCQGALSTANRPQVRIIDVSPDAPEVDVYQNSSVLAYRLGFGTITSYVAVEPGTYTTRAAMTGTRQTLASSKATLASMGQYTVLIGNYTSSLEQVTLKDQNQPAPPGHVALRFVDQATLGGPVDIYLVPAGQRLNSVKPTVTKTSFGANTGYLNLPAGTYTLEVVPAGGTEALYTGAQVTYASGSASTVVLVDQREESGVQVILAPDYVPPSAE